jgi:hypothetical protein
MTAFMLLYKGPATPPEEMAPDQVQAVMQKWQAWMGGVGEALTDMGAPMGNGTAIVDDGSIGAATQLNGYSIVEAADIEAAKALVDGHPFLSDATGNFSVEVHELLPIPM